jgi:hypothetical protein
VVIDLIWRLLKELIRGKTVEDAVSAAFMENGQVKVYTASVNEFGVNPPLMRNATVQEKAMMQGNRESPSNVFNETGARGIHSNDGERIKKHLDTAGTEGEETKINPNEIRFSQSSVNGASELTTSMKAHGWKGDPINVVKMPDGKLSTLDNTRVVAARQSGIDVQSNVHDYDDPLPSILVRRFTTPKGVPKTWGEALGLRIGKQNTTFRHEYPSGSFDLPKINN